MADPKFNLMIAADRLSCDLMTDAANRQGIGLENNQGEAEQNEMFVMIHAHLFAAAKLLMCMSISENKSFDSTRDLLVTNAGHIWDITITEADRLRRDIGQNPDTPS